MSIPLQGRARAPGFTLVELVVAAGLMTLLIVTLFSLVDDFLSLWEKSELRRQVIEEGSGVTELLAADLSSLEPGPRGDLLCEWVFHDTDGDGVSESKWPRLRLVRNASPRELALHQAARPDERKELGEGLLEVVWVVLPARARSNERDLRAEGFLWRGERLYGSSEGISVFDDAYFSTTGRPAAGAVSEVTGGVLWLDLAFATQTSSLADGWESGGLGGVTPSWDAWLLERANFERHVWNEFGAGMPEVDERPLMPRRVRITLEIERTKDLKRRTRSLTQVGPEDTAFAVDDGRRLPEPGAFVLLDAEWMQVVSTSGERLSVKRGARGTTPAPHEPGALVHHGMRVVREVPIATHQEDWNL